MKYLGRHLGSSLVCWLGDPRVCVQYIRNTPSNEDGCSDTPIMLFSIDEPFHMHRGGAFSVSCHAIRIRKDRTVGNG